MLYLILLEYERLNADGLHKSASPIIVYTQCEYTCVITDIPKYTQMLQHATNLEPKQSILDGKAA